MAKTSKLLSLLIIILLTLSSLPFVSADNNPNTSIILITHWHDNNENSITAEQGDTPQLYVFIRSHSNFDLWIDQIQDQTLTNLFHLEDLLPSFSPNPPYSQVFPINTEELSGDYFIRVKVMNDDGDNEASLLNLHVNVPVLLDSDRDGIPDNRDSCPNQPGPAENQGCPEEKPKPADQDGDNIPDESDNCPVTPNPDQLDSDHDGRGDLCDSYPHCPSDLVDECGICDGPGKQTWYQDQDNDNLGDPNSPIQACQQPEGYVPNPNDACSNQPGPAENNGCPIEEPCSDLDNDGICDEDESPPIIQAIADQTLAEKETLTLHVTASDPNQDPLTLVVMVEDYVNQNAINIDYTDNRDGTLDFTFTPAHTFVQHPATQKAFEVTILVSDQDPSTPDTQATFQVTVTDVNQPPVLDSLNIPPETLVNQETSFSATATDPDGDELTYTWTFGDETTSHQQNPTHTYTSAGTYPITLTITDGFEGKIIQTEEINVKEPPIEGCTDPEALNYNPEATLDDGSCQYPPKEIPGCTDKNALNYNPDATQDDGSCQYPPEEIEGCTDPEALNYNPEATLDDGSCQYPPTENHPPVITSSPSRTTQENEEYTYQIIALDPDGDKLTYHLLQGPSDISLDENGLLTWTPERHGKFCLIIKVTEETQDAFTDTQHFCINVRDLEKTLKFNNLNLPSEIIPAGDYLPIFIDLYNGGDEDLENIKITAVIYELGIRRSVGPFDLEQDDNVHKTLYLEIPYDAQPGEYHIRITAGNSEVTHLTHRIIEII